MINICNIIYAWNRFRDQVVITADLCMSLGEGGLQGHQNAELSLLAQKRLASHCSAFHFHGLLKIKNESLLFIGLSELYICNTSMQKLTFFGFTNQG
ncbi:hypothetical protein FKM82_010523 [Ascaphus truei]